MTKEEIAAKAVEYKHSGYNCAQSVVKALAEAEGMDPTLLLQQTAGFAVGMGGMEATCGALIGANMFAGIRTEGKGTLKVSKALLRRFSARCGASICRELKGRDTGVELCGCDDCVRNAVCALGDVLDLS